MSRVFAASENVVFRIRDTRLAQKYRPGAIRGVPDSRLETAPRAPFGAPKMDARTGFYVCKKLIPIDFGRFSVCVNPTIQKRPESQPKTDEL